MDDYDGAEVVDTDGDKIGTVERTYTDDKGGARLLEVKIGALFAKHRLVPLDGANTDAGTIVVPYSKETVEGAPEPSSLGDTLEGGPLDTVWDYYAARGAGAQPSPSSVDSSDNEPAAVPVGQSDTDDQTGNQSETPKGTPVEAASSPNPAAGQIREDGDVIEIPIVEERLVKQPVVKEVLRVRKSVVTDQSSATGEVRKEDVEVIDSEVPVGADIQGDQ